jgi:hypothetical protein
VLGIALPAHGSVRPSPWSGGSEQIVPFEALASRVATFLAGHRVSIQCVDAPKWRSLAAEHDFDSSNTWALTPLHWDSTSRAAVADGHAYFSPRACRLADSFVTKPTEIGTRICRHGARTRWETRAVGRRGETTTRRVPVPTPILGECDEWGSKLLAVHVLSHESVHLAGVGDEAEADCLAAQADAFVARALGADPRFARLLAREYWAQYYASQDQRYRSPSCHDGGKLDLVPTSKGWPTPAVYPSNFASRIRDFAPSSRVSAALAGRFTAPAA